MSRSFPYLVVAAFSKGPFNGNPAAAVFIDENLETDTLMKIAANLNQPITSVIGPQIPSADKTAAAFSIRWFTPTFHEIPICGHGTMVAARAIFEKGLVADSVEVIELHTKTGGVMKARKVATDGVGIEIRLPSGTLTDVSSEERPKIAAAVSKAFGRNVAIKYIGAGGKGFENYVMVELDEQEKLGKSEVDAVALLDTGYTINVITTASSSGEELFVSRMFAPVVIPPPFEDQVCGSAHCLTGPYWHQKNSLATDQAFDAKMVSSRGGDLNVFWDQTAAVIALKGETFVMASGEIYI
ncbi:hypothetical protein DFH08DRAFT_684971 [Mycena albidolilacea]|uniref:Diaminopimelate epimerase-like protein n=1 Tax=Mycena albidolilacea TaxID=1033008 RepID=A0AAD7AK66_9AGAR|nr:hypothetical protein DFH08DRAFT_684971 [Mycena albidolilacea]